VAAPHPAALDIDAAITSGRYSLRQLCDLTAEAGRGFEPKIFADMLRLAERFDDPDFIANGPFNQTITRRSSLCRLLSTVVDGTLPSSSCLVHFGYVVPFVHRSAPIPRKCWSMASDAP